MPLDELAAELLASPDYQKASSSDARKRAAERFLMPYLDGFRPTPLICNELYARAQHVFSIVQEKVSSPNDFASTAQLAATLLAFTGRYNQNARPFNWKYTAADLTGLLQRISAHHEPASQPARGCLTPPNLRRHPTKPRLPVALSGLYGADGGLPDGLGRARPGHRRE